MKKVHIIGAGPAGIIAAIKASQNGNSVILHERNNSIGKKLLLTGKGRCNITSDLSVDEIIFSFGKNGRFLYPSLNKFSPNKLLELLKNIGVLTRLERGKRYYLSPDNKYKFTYYLERELLKNKLAINYNSLIKKISVNKNYISKINDVSVENDIIIISTGGITYPQTGSDGSIMKELKKIGIKIKEPKGVLVPFYTDIDEYCSKMQGFSLKNINVNVLNKDHFGEVSFVSNGISGSILLKLNKKLIKYFENNSKCEIYLDLKPALSKKKLLNRIEREKKNGRIKIDHFLGALIPAKFRKLFLKKLNIPKDVKLDNNISVKIVELLKRFPIILTKPFEGKYGIITEGGVDLLEIDPKTMRSKKYNNLYFCGEIIDLDAPCGGFNLQMAFSTGYLAGNLV